MAAIILPQRHSKQPKGRVQIAREFESLVLSAAIGGQFWNVARAEIESASGVGVGSGVYGTSDDTTISAAPKVGEPSAPGDAWFSFCSYLVVQGSGITMLLGNDSSSSSVGAAPRLRVSQFRQNGVVMEHIRFNTNREAVVAAIAHGIPGGDPVTVGSWSRGNVFGVISSPAGEGTGTITGTPESWSQEWTPSGGVAHWYQRRSGNGFAEIAKSHFFIRVVLSDPLDFEFRRDILANPYQIFRADPVRIYSLAAATIPTLSNPGVTDIGSTSVRPQVTLTY